jgi:broad specificity phosphatase PhoE
VGQASAVAKIIKELQIDTLIASPFVRARQTAQIISETIDMPYILEESFVEFRRPDNLYGKRHISLGSLAYLFKLFIHQEDPTWDNDGAENMFTVRNRVVDAKRILIEAEGERIVVVTHAIFMDMFVEMVCRERSLTLFQFLHGLLLTKKTPNTGIIHLTYDAQAPKGICPWQLMEFNYDQTVTYEA